MDVKTQRYLSLGLSALNIAGVVGTFIFVAKETPKYNSAKKMLSEDASKMKKTKTFIKNYRMSLIFASSAIASGICSKVISNKTEASLLATAGLIDASLRKYKNVVKDKLGPVAERNIIKDFVKEHFPKDDIPKVDGEVLYMEEHIGYFYAKPEDLYKGMMIIQQELNGSNYYTSGCDTIGCVTLGEFLRLINGRPLSHTLSEARLNFGWSADYLMDGYGYESVHFDIVEGDEEEAKIIQWHEPPIWNPSMWYDHMYNECTDEKYFEGADSKFVNFNSSVYEVYK